MSHLPMSHPELAIKVAPNRFGRPSIMQLDDGSLLMAGWDLFFRSTDCSMTWDEGAQHCDTDGRPIKSSEMSLVKLSNGGIGVGGIDRDHTVGRGYSRHLFWRSDDGGRTWAPPVQINPPDKAARSMHSVMIRTTSGRLIVPFYVAVNLEPWMADGKLSVDDEPTGGGLVDGNFYVSSDCHNFDPCFGYCYTCHSDDDGRTWHTNENGSLYVVLETGSAYGSVFEPTMVEVSPRRLLMFMRTGLGRLYQSWSQDDGTTWSRPEPSVLAASHSPAHLKRLPDGHLLCLWTQHSHDEIRRGFTRTRLSSAISRNGGIMWEYFQNVESIHEKRRVDPGPIHATRPAEVYRLSGRLADERDHRFVEDFPLGYGRWSYPMACVCRDRVIILHSYTKYRADGGHTPADESRGYLILPLKWFYGGCEPGESVHLPQRPNEPAVP